MQKAFRDYTHLPCMGVRMFVKMHKPEGARFPLKVRCCLFQCLHESKTVIRIKQAEREKEIDVRFSISAAALNPLSLTTPTRRRTRRRRRRKK